jgi:hypothetical protein
MLKAGIIYSGCVHIFVISIDLVNLLPTGPTTRTHEDSGTAMAPSSGRGIASSLISMGGQQWAAPIEQQCRFFIWSIWTRISCLIKPHSWDGRGLPPNKVDVGVGRRFFQVVQRTTAEDSERVGVREGSNEKEGAIF